MCDVSPSQDLLNQAAKLDEIANNAEAEGNHRTAALFRRKARLRREEAACLEPDAWTAYLNGCQPSV